MCDQHNSIFHALSKKNQQNSELKAPFTVRSMTPSVQPVPHRLPPTVPSRRKKLWEIDSCYHCSVIGTCLTLGELRLIMQRLHLPSHALQSDYEWHRAFVAGAKQVSPATRLITKQLDRKYKKAIEQLGKAPTTTEAQTYWQNACETGDVAGAYWALLTHPSISEDLLDRVYGEVHMLSHLAGASIRVDMQQLAQWRRRCESLTRQLAESQQTNRLKITEQQKIIEALKQRLLKAQDCECRLSEMEARIAALTSTEQIADPTEIVKAQEQANYWQQRALQAEENQQQLQQQLNHAHAERELLETTLQHFLTPPCMETHPTKASCLDLAGRCILYVGGRPQQCAHFRELVERYQGRFIYHDGGREDARAQLWENVRQADVILCPMDCVSHDAVHRIKRWCSQSPKPFILLPRSSLAAFTRGLNTAWEQLHAQPSHFGESLQ